MIVGTIIMVTGPFGNYIMPIMIGARDMAFPRLNALSFWLIVAAAVPLIWGQFIGGITTGWTAYNPLAGQAPLGMNGYIMFICIFALSTMVAGANITTTVVRMRARGMTWNRTPIFIYGVVASVALALPAFPVFFLSQVMSAFDRALGTSFYDTQSGGSGWLYENLFWIMGHPEVYVILIPAVAALMEMAPVFTRRPLYSFNIAVMGIAGISGLSILVWAHHMYMSGWAPLLNTPFMLTTELISIPTGMLFLVLVGTLWRGRLWVTVPTMSIFALLWNFMIGGVTGIYLSDVPADAFLHGSMFVTAHFHYTLMGAGLTGAIASLIYWFPKMTGRMFDNRLGLDLLLAHPGWLQCGLHGNVLCWLARSTSTCRGLLSSFQQGKSHNNDGCFHHHVRHADFALRSYLLMAQWAESEHESMASQNFRVDRCKPSPTRELCCAAHSH
jgi:cytochrome c oxidase subunit 1